MFIIKEKKIEKLYPPQIEAIKLGLFNGENLVISTSTATGKTFLAEIAMVNTVLTKNVKAVFTVPLKAIAWEKFHDLKIYEKLGVKVAVSTGDYDREDKWLEKYDIIITTYEKFDSLLRHKASWLYKIGLLIIDEIHYINDEKRGPIIESIIAKIKSLNINLQILALSATIENVEEIAKWLNAKYVKSNWRPVNLREGVYFDGKIYYNDGTIKNVKRISDPITDLSIDTLLENGQVLIFTNSRANTIKIAQHLAYKISDYSEKLIDIEKTSKIINEVRNISKSKLLAEELAKVIKYGVAFHHAGLDYECRELIENYFRDRIIKIVVATTTLAAGVNLPARRVIIHDYRRYEPGIGFEQIPVMEYKQMAGRAGRPGLDPYGEAILIAKNFDEIEYLREQYINAKPEPVISKFFNDRNLATQILAIVASEYASTFDNILDYLYNTLGAYQRGIISNYILKNLVKKQVDYILKFLEQNNFIKCLGSKYEATSIGKIVNLTYLDPYTASIYINGLRSKVETCDFAYIHLIIKSPEVPKLRVRKSEYSKYFEYITKYWNDLLIKPTSNIDELVEDIDSFDEFISEIKTTLMIMDWINEYDEDIILQKYDVGPGDLRMYCDTLEWLIHSAERIAKALGMNKHVENLEILKYRVRYGVKPELLELVVNLEGVGRVRARALYDAGFKTIEDIANTSPSVIALHVKGIGEKLAEKIVNQARQLIKEDKVKKFKIEKTFREVEKEISKRKGFTILDFLSS